MRILKPQRTYTVGSPLLPCRVARHGSRGLPCRALQRSAPLPRGLSEWSRMRIRTAARRIERCIAAQQQCSEGWLARAGAEVAAAPALASAPADSVSADVRSCDTPNHRIVRKARDRA